ncbi:MAG: hypothetical protein P4L99_14515 [Chthoniobacter sp.]|nr:hypothetical protein [Chthoniobacter sp.]
MKTGNVAKSRIHLEPIGPRWTLFVDDKPVISTHDRRWLLRFAVNLRKSLATASPS